MKQLGQGLEVGAAVKRLHSCPLPSGFPTTTTTIIIVVTITIITTTNNNNDDNNNDDSNNNNNDNDMGTAVKRLHSCPLPSGRVLIYYDSSYDSIANNR